MEIPNAQDESILTELNSIKKLLSVDLSENYNHISTLNSYDKIYDFWPTLLLPRNI